MVLDDKMKNISKEIPPLRGNILSKKAQGKQDEIQKIYIKLISGGMIEDLYCIGRILNG